MDIKDLVPIDYAKQRVLTSAQLAKAYNCPSTRIRDNFRRHKEQFQEGVHYFKLEGDALNEFKAQAEGADNIRSTRGYKPSPLANVTHSALLWTVQGAVRHCKLINTQQAWDVFSELEQFYFNGEACEVSTPDTSAIRALDARIDSLQAQIDEINQVLSGLDILFKELFEGKNAPMERADKLLAIADKIRQDDVRDKVLLQAANLILGKKLF